MAELTVIKWRDIPMQIVVRDDAGGSARRLLPEKFQEAVDAAAMVAGLIGSDDYTEQMHDGPQRGRARTSRPRRRPPRTPCSPSGPRTR